MHCHISFTNIPLSVPTVASVGLEMVKQFMVLFVFLLQSEYLSHIIKQFHLNPGL